MQINRHQTGRSNSPWRHFLVGVLLIGAAITWGVQFRTLEITKLDLLGITVPGEASLIPNREIAEYDCTFTTRTGEIIHGRKLRGPKPSAFVYLPENPRVFKVKGEGRGTQLGLVIFSLLGIWQIVSGIMVYRRARQRT